jgi:hypothetical protein
MHLAGPAGRRGDGLQRPRPPVPLSGQYRGLPGPAALPREPIAVQAVAAGQDTLNSCRSPGELGVDCRAQVFPFQRITAVTSLADPVMSWSPTAVRACGEEQDTAFSSLISVCDNGVGITRQAFPFQCSARVPSW